MPTMPTMPTVQSHPTADHDAVEYRTLRDTIRERGTRRLILFWATFAVWAALLTATAVTGADPLVTLARLVLLAAGFEAVYALHVGVERIGRYLQVFHEHPDEGPAWEHAAMAYGSGPTTARLDPLFTGLFGLAAVLNLAPSLPAVRPIPTGIVVLAHLVFVVRVVAARRYATRQRGEDLERFTQVRAGLRAGGA